MTHANKIKIFLLSCFLTVFGFAGQSVGMGAITDAILSTTGISRDRFSTIYMAAMILSGVFAYFASKLIWKFGIRKSALSVLLIWSAVLALVGSSFKIYDSFFHSVKKSSYFFALFCMTLPITRCIGKSIFPMIGHAQILSIFDKHQGLAIATSGMFVSLVTGIAPRIMHALSHGDSWQDAYKTLSIISVIVFAIFFVLFRGINTSNIIHSDENVDTQTTGEQPHDDIDASGSQFLKDPAFWCILSAGILQLFLGGGIAVHVVDIFREKGLSESTARGSYLYLACFTIISNFAFGGNFSKTCIKHRLIAMLSLQLMGMVGLDLLSFRIGLPIYIVCMGAAWGAHSIMNAAAYSKIFGNKNVVRIFGVTYGLIMLIEASAIPLMSISRSKTGSYFSLIRTIDVVIIALTVFVIKKFPKYRDAERTPSPADSTANA